MELQNLIPYICYLVKHTYRTYQNILDNNQYLSYKYFLSKFFLQSPPKSIIEPSHLKLTSSFYIYNIFSHAYKIFYNIIIFWFSYNFVVFSNFVIKSCSSDNFILYFFVYLLLLNINVICHQTFFIFKY